MSKERPRLLLVSLVLVLQGCMTSASIEDNKIPGQPEEVSPLGLPTDEESFNQLSVFFDPSKVPGSVGSGTYHFVSSTFPEVDARGFHESVFDGIGDYFPSSWPTSYKRGADSYPASPSLAQRLGLQPRNKFRKRSEPPKVRKKRAISSSNSSQELTRVSDDCELGQCVGRLVKREVSSEEDESEKKNARTKDGESKPKHFQPEQNNLNGISEKKSGARYVRGMEMGSSGFHGDVFNGDFGDCTTTRKRARGSSGFHGDTFSDGFGDFTTMKRTLRKKRLLTKIKEYFNSLAGNNGVESENDAHVLNSPDSQLEDEEDLDDPDRIVKRRPEMTSMGFHGDTFNGGFGDFYPVKKRRPEMDSMGFHGDTFTRGFGEFDPLKKRRALAGSMGFHGDTFSQGFGDFDTYKKRRPEMDSSGFHGDTFSRGFGEFEPFKKRRASPGSLGFHGDTFSQGFGDFDTYKKRRPEMDSMGFHGDTFNRGFGEFEPLKKRRPATGSMGFHGDTFSQGFGNFETYKKRRPEMDSMGFHGDTFNRGFGDFDVYKKRSIAPSEVEEQTSNHGKLEDKKSCSTQSCGSLRL